MYNKLSRHQTNMRKLLEPEIAARRSKYQEEGIDYQDKPVNSSPAENSVY